MTPKQFKLMMEAYERCGGNAKAILHQGGHASLGSNYDTMKIGSFENYLWIVNRWFSQYLAGHECGADRIPKYLIQSSTDGKFYSYNEWETGENFIFDMGEGDMNINKNVTCYWFQDIAEDTTIKGEVEVHLRLKADNVDFDKTAVKVTLYDDSDSYFQVYCGDNMSTSHTASTALYGESDDRWLSIYQYNSVGAYRMKFTSGQADICTPTAGWEPYTSAVSETPVNANEWHDYVIYLEPSAYTVRAGHSLCLTVETCFENFNSYSPGAAVTIDRSASYAVIPTDSTPVIQYSR